MVIPLQLSRPNHSNRVRSETPSAWMRVLSLEGGEEGEEREEQGVSLSGGERDWEAADGGSCGAAVLVPLTLSDSGWFRLRN